MEKEKERESMKSNSKAVSELLKELEKAQKGGTTMVHFKRTENPINKKHEVVVFDFELVGLAKEQYQLPHEDTMGKNEYIWSIASLITSLKLQLLYNTDILKNVL
jgi:hypothetical protein